MSPQQALRADVRHAGRCLLGRYECMAMSYATKPYDKPGFDADIEPVWLAPPHALEYVWHCDECAFQSEDDWQMHDHRSFHEYVCRPRTEDIHVVQEPMMEEGRP